MQKTLTVALVGLILATAVPSFARISGNRISSNGVAVTGFETSVLTVQSVVLPDGSVVDLR